MNRFGKVIFFFSLSIFIPFTPLLVFAWPTAGQWIPVYKGGVFLQDPGGDAQGSRNIVSDPTHEAAFIFNDGQYVYFRLRLDQNPTGTGGQGFLQPYGWGVEIDTNLFDGDYEWLLMVDGISRTEIIQLRQNTVQGTLGDPSDATETVCSSIPISMNHQVNPADSSINGDLDYFLDWRFPYDTFKHCTGLSDASPIRLFFGSSSSTNNLTEQGADLVGGSDLYTGFSDYVGPFGTRPTTGIVRFVTDLVGNTDLTVITAGQSIYIRVDDGDQNHDATTSQAVNVAIATQSGDTETTTLMETGVNTGIFTGSLPSAHGAALPGDGAVQVNNPDEIATVTYMDLVDRNLSLSQPRTDTLTVLLPPVISITKTANPSAVAAGGLLQYVITISNSGQGEGFVTQIQDVLPAGFRYVAGSTSGLTVEDPAVNGQLITWSGMWAVPRRAEGVNGELTHSFQARAGSAGGTYYDVATVSGANFSVATTGDTAPVTVTAPLISLTKEVDKESAGPGDEVTYSVHYRNRGDGPAYTVIIMDTVPDNASYIAGSLRLGDGSSSYATADPLSDAPGDDQGEVNGSGVIFTVTVVAPDDGVEGSGPDEGKVHFKVRIL